MDYVLPNIPTNPDFILYGDFDEMNCVTVLNRLAPPYTRDCR